MKNQKRFSNIKYWLKIIRLNKKKETERRNFLKCIKQDISIGKNHLLLTW